MKRIPKKIEKPWGFELWYADNGLYLGKILCLYEGHRTSLQKHEKKHESLYVSYGKVKLLYNNEEIEFSTGECIDIPPNTEHRFTALTDATLIETSTYHPEDVIRIEDDYGR